MLRSTFYQQSLLEVDPDELRLKRGSFERELRSVLPKLVSVEDFRPLHPSAEGADTCDPLVLTGMLLLQYRFGLGDEDLIERCIRDLGFRHALALEKGVAPPSQASLKRFRAAMRRLKGPDWLFKLSLKLALEAGYVAADELQALDSTNTDQRGATLDTFNLISAAIRAVILAMAPHLDVDPRELGRRWDATRYLGRSLKGRVSINWSDEAERNALLTSEINDVERIVKLANQALNPLPEDVEEAIGLMRDVAYQDVEQQADGTFKIVRGTARGRIVSITDPEARHGHKSSSQVITGFKTHTMGTIKSQFVTATVVTSAEVHDSVPTPRLIEQAASVGLKPTDAVGDAAYGTGPNRHACRELGVTLHTKLPTPSHDGFPKRDFKIDLNTMSVTCPGGETTTTYSMVKEGDGSDDRVPQFRFPRATCEACPLRAACAKTTADGRGRLIKLNRHEAELQEAQRMNAQPEEKAILRQRSAIERLQAHLVRMGMRQARFFGLAMVQFQAFMTAAAYNLQRYMTLAAAAA
jgi:hypothetical protein